VHRAYAGSAVNTRLRLLRVTTAMSFHMLDLLIFLNGTILYKLASCVSNPYQLRG
jgi:hypothetical protein